MTLTAALRDGELPASVVALDGVRALTARITSWCIETGRPEDVPFDPDFQDRFTELCRRAAPRFLEIASAVARTALRNVWNVIAGRAGSTAPPAP